MKLSRKTTFVLTFFQIMGGVIFVSLALLDIIVLFTLYHWLSNWGQILNALLLILLIALTLFVFPYSRSKIEQKLHFSYRRQTLFAVSLFIILLTILFVNFKLQEQYNAEQLYCYQYPGRYQSVDISYSCQTLPTRKEFLHSDSYFEP